MARGAGATRARGDAPCPISPIRNPLLKRHLLGALPEVLRDDREVREGLPDPLSLGAFEAPPLPRLVILHPLAAVPDHLAAIDRILQHHLDGGGRPTFAARGRDALGVQAMRDRAKSLPARV